MISFDIALYFVLGAVLMVLWLWVVNTLQFKSGGVPNPRMDDSAVVHLSYPEHTAVHHDLAILTLSATSRPVDLRMFMHLYSECPIISSSISKQWLLQHSEIPPPRLVYALAYEFPNKLFVHWIKYGATIELKSWALSIQLWLAEHQTNHPALPYSPTVTQWLHSWDISDTGFTCANMVRRIKQATLVLGDWVRYDSVTEFAGGQQITFHPE
jgi:hypothetical protein